MKGFGRDRRWVHTVVLAAAAPVEGGPGALGPRRWFTESARPHSAPKYVCYAPHSADPVSSLIRAGYLKGRRSGSPRPEPSGQRDIGIIVLADLLNGSQGGGVVVTGSGKGQRSRGSRDTEGSPTSAVSLSQLCAPAALPTHGEEATTSHNAPVSSIITDENQGFFQTLSLQESTKRAPIFPSVCVRGGALTPTVASGSGFLLLGVSET